MKKKLFKIKLLVDCRLRIEDYLKGQGIVESVVAVGILMMVLTGTVLLVSFGLSNRKTGFDRRKANELATLVMEEQVSISQANPVIFWNLTPIPSKTNPSFLGYSYSIDFTNIPYSPDYPNCSNKPSYRNCAMMVVNIGWSGKDIQNLIYERFIYSK